MSCWSCFGGGGGGGLRGGGGSGGGGDRVRGNGGGAGAALAAVAVVVAAVVLSLVLLLVMLLVMDADGDVSKGIDTDNGKSRVYEGPECLRRTFCWHACFSRVVLSIIMFAGRSTRSSSWSWRLKLPSSFFQ